MRPERPVESREDSSDLEVVSNRREEELDPDVHAARDRSTREALSAAGMSRRDFFASLRPSRSLDEEDVDREAQREIDMLRQANAEVTRRRATQMIAGGVASMLSVFGLDKFFGTRRGGEVEAKQEDPADFAKEAFGDIDRFLVREFGARVRDEKMHMLADRDGVRERFIEQFGGNAIESLMQRVFDASVEAKDPTLLWQLHDRLVKAGDSHGMLYEFLARRKQYGLIQDKLLDIAAYQQTDLDRYSGEYRAQQGKYYTFLEDHFRVRAEDFLPDASMLHVGEIDPTHFDKFLSTKNLPADAQKEVYAAYIADVQAKYELIAPRASRSDMSLVEVLSMAKAMVKQDVAADELFAIREDFLKRTLWGRETDEVIIANSWDGIFDGKSVEKTFVQSGVQEVVRIDPNEDTEAPGTFHNTLQTSRDNTVLYINAHGFPGAIEIQKGIQEPMTEIAQSLWERVSGVYRKKGLEAAAADMGNILIYSGACSSGDSHKALAKALFTEYEEGEYKGDFDDVSFDVFTLPTMVSLVQPSPVGGEFTAVAEDGWRMLERMRSVLEDDKGMTGRRALQVLQPMLYARGQDMSFFAGQKGGVVEFAEASDSDKDNPPA